MMYLAPWADVMLPAAVLDAHAARCRSLVPPARDDTPPNVIAQLLADSPPDVQERARVAAQQAAEMSAEMHGYQLTDVHPDPFRELYQSPSERNFETAVYYSGRGAKKTSEVARALIELARDEKHPRQKIGCLRAFQNSISDSVHANVAAIIRREGLEGEFEIQAHAIIHNTTKSSFSFHGLQNYLSLKSTLFDVAWVEEADQCERAQFLTLIPSIRSENSCLIITFNSGTNSFCDTDMIGHKGEMRERTLIRYVDISHNEYLYRSRLASEFRSAFKAGKHAGNLDEWLWVWKGHERKRPENLAIPQFTVGAPDIPERVFDLSQTLVGLDYSNGGAGVDADPHHVVKAYAWSAPDIYGDRFDPEDPTHRPVVWVTAEWMGKATTRQLAQHVQRVAGPLPPGRHIIADCANGLLTDDLVDEYGLPVIRCKKGKGSVELGLQLLNSFDIYVLPECKNLIRQLNAYHWTDKGTLGGERHGCDALRYGAFGGKDGGGFKNEPADGGVVYLALQRKLASDIVSQLEFEDQ